jgi:hypothetical protein
VVSKLIFINETGDITIYTNSAKGCNLKKKKGVKMDNNDKSGLQNNELIFIFEPKRKMK